MQDDINKIYVVFALQCCTINTTLKRGEKGGVV